MGITQEQRYELLHRFVTGEPLEIAGLKVSVAFKLEKFNGEYEAGKEPVEVIEGGDNQPTIVTRREQVNGA